MKTSIIDPVSPDKPPLVVIVVLNWNRSRLTLECLSAIESLSYRNFRVLLIDNGSADDPLPPLPDLPPNVTLLRSAENLGYAGGNNMAIARALAEGAAYVWLVNNDAVVTPDSLTLLVAAAERDPGVGMVGPLLRRPGDGEEHNPVGLLFHLDQPVMEATTDIETARRWQAERPDRFAVSGAALLVRRSLLEKTGGFDARLFAYYEDIDLSIRCVQAGFRNAMEFAATVHHQTHPSSDSRIHILAPHVYYYMARNDILLWRKHCTRRRVWKGALWELDRQLRRIRDWPLRSRHDIAVEAMLLGLWDGWRGVGGRYDPSRRMPEPLRGLLLASPGFWIRLLDALSAIGRRGARRT
jgi:GT2 family glycosyltransferase